ncbi:MAG: hypothetical protein P4L69_10770 [Desulfosporosinus sp.]|nr:hypothetical protein [Desulfosporosinus sp.]
MNRNQHYKVICNSIRQEPLKSKEQPVQKNTIIKSKPKSNIRWLKRIIIWTLVGILLQIPVYYVLNQMIQNVMNPTSLAQKTSVQGDKFTLAAPNINNPLVSYDDNYLAFRSDRDFLIYNFGQHSVIWKMDQTGSKKVLGYQWLPDRNALLVFEAGLGVNPAQPGRMSVGIHSLEVTGNPDKIQDSFSLTLPLSFQRSQISDISLSTATNLLYFSVQGQAQSNLYEVDVMKNLKRLNRLGEYVDSLVVSPVKGTVYFNTKGTTTGQTLAVNGNARVQVASNPLDKVLGLWNQKLYLGTVDQGYLVKIWTIPDNQPSPTRPDFSLFWTGKVPWDQSSISNLDGYSLLVRTAEALYQVSPQGSKILRQGERSFLSLSGKYYYAFKTDSSGTSLTRIGL